MSDSSFCGPCHREISSYFAYMSSIEPSEIGKSKPTRRAPQRRRAEAMLEKIYEATEALITRDGLLSLSTNRIAREAAVSVGAIYQYFPNKEAILVSIYRRALDRAWDEVLQIDREMGEAPDLGQFASIALPRFSSIDRDIFAPFILSLGSSSIPEIDEADRQHNAKVAAWLADLLSRMGSPWPEERLQRYSIFLFSVFSAATWEALQQIGSIDNEVELWRDGTIMHLVSKALIPD